MAKSKAPASEAPPAEYTVLARRYRPQQFADLIGQEPVAQTLVNAIQSGRIAHAYLFTGVRGVGKTSAARILAKALNCEKGPTPTPCDKCESCRAIAVGEDVDVLEIDGASNNSVDDIRDLRQNAQFRPSRSRYRIYIIDEVHMLAASAQKSAFNALLKLLEEPPAHVKFIFATTEVRKIPDTILSRCQRFDFIGIPSQRIVGQLRTIVASEGREADDEALELVARRAGGSMRDAQSLLDQLLAFGGERLTAELVHKMLGTAPDDVIAALAAAVLGKDTKQALAMLGEGLGRGLQPGELLDQLIGYWRDLMLVATGGAEVAGLNASARLRDSVVAQAASVSLDTILAGLDILQTTLFRLRGSSHGRVLLEMAIIRLSRLDDLMSLSQLAQMLQGADGAPTPRPAAPPSLAAARPSPPADLAKKKSSEVGDAPNKTPLTNDNLRHVWSEVLTQVGPFLGRELEKAGLPAIIGPNRVVLRFPLAYNRQCEFCSDPVRLNRVLDALERVTSETWDLRLEVAPGLNGQTRPEALAKPELAAAPAATVQHPLLQATIELLGARLLKIDDGFGQAAEPVAEDAEEPEIVSEER
jgi:DNA polymerase-3 subunit gamma/tau